MSVEICDVMVDKVITTKKEATVREAVKVKSKKKIVQKVLAATSLYLVRAYRDQ